MPVSQQARCGLRPAELCSVSQTDFKREHFSHESSGDWNSREHTLGNIATDEAGWKEGALWIWRGLGPGETCSQADISTPGSWVECARVPGLCPLTQSPPPRCVVLKLASLGMFSFSLGQTVLCIGRNKTSCKSYGYDACDYQVTIRAVPPVPLHKAPAL